MDETVSTASTAPASAAGQGLSRRAFAAVLAGNALEFYDFLTFSFFAVQIGRTFFPGQGEADRLLLTLATFGAGFLTRPLGGIVLGRMADRIGRKPVLQISFVLMGLSVTGLALTPGYAAIGVAAPVLVLAFRLLQGFALGGDVGASTAYMIEAAPPERRGLYGSFQSATSDVAVLTAGLVGAALAHLLTPAQLDAWGWRAAFLLGAAIVPVGFFLRQQLVETLPEPGPPEPHEALRAHLPLAAMGLVLLAGATVVNYTLQYMTTYAITTLHMPATDAFGATVVIGAVLVACDLFSGRLSDRFGRKPVMMIPWAMLLVLALPSFLLLSQVRSPGVLLSASAFLSVLIAFGTAPVLTSITEALPARVRAGSLALIYALSISLFGGTTQFMVAWLIRVTGNPLAPAFYMTGAVALSLVVMVFLPETAPLAHRRTKAALSSASAASPA